MGVDQFVQSGLLFGKLMCVNEDQRSVDIRVQKITSNAHLWLIRWHSGPTVEPGKQNKTEKKGRTQK